MAPEPLGNIRVFVRWHDQTVFAGEEVRCTITFKNVASGSKQQRGNQQQSSLSPLEKNRLGGTLHSRAVKASAGLAPPSAASGRGHRRPALSYSGPPVSARGRSGSIQWPQTSTIGDSRSNHGHNRSVSIVSIGSTSTVEDASQRSEGSARPQRPSPGHNRASSLQIVPRGQPSPPVGPNSAGFSPRSTSSPMFNGSYPPDRFGRRSSGSTGPNTPAVGTARRSPKTSPNSMPEFRFPAAPPPDSEPQQDQDNNVEDGLLSPRLKASNHNNIPVRQRDQVPAISEQRPTPAARVLSTTSLTGGTPRSSGEFYSVSNHSSETLASEYVAQPTTSRSQRRPAHVRRGSSAIPQTSKGPESLMMGFAQINGSFILDGSLVSLTPFEQVKKKAAVGGRGGGVIGLESTKRDAGLLRGFGWSNISTSLGDLLGGGDLSTIKEMREVANSKSVPLLSTPQSILFVDLQLAPGETRVFEYSFQLPRGLPPSHKGKAVKIVYNLVIGTQRAGGAKEQQVRSVEVPFRVLGSVNSYGEILGHDLMSPYVLLRDEARIKSPGQSPNTKSPTRTDESPATLNEFLTYVDELVAKSVEGKGIATLSPSITTNSRRPSMFHEATTASEAINLAVLRSNVAAEGQQSPNRFEIARNGQRVGIVMLTRPVYRLGEVVTMAIDFSDADVPCYAVHTTLESSEKIDPSLAVRSESSIQRVTRKVYVTSSEATLYSRRVVFTPTIPISAAPEFMTSGVSLEWKIRVEFVVPSRGPEILNPWEQQAPHPLLEKISQDEKGGMVLAAAETLVCESFDVIVPLRVYGAVGNGLERLERDEASEEGLVV